MGRVRKHVHRLHFQQPVAAVAKQPRIAGEGGRIAGYVHDARRSLAHDLLHHSGMNAGARRIQHYHIGATVLLKQGGCSGHVFFEITDHKRAVRNAVQLGVGFRILHRFRNDLHADDPSGFRTHENADGTGAAVQIVQRFAAGELRKVQGGLIQHLRPLGVGLEK